MHPKIRPVLAMGVNLRVDHGPDNVTHEQVHKEGVGRMLHTLDIEGPDQLWINGLHVLLLQVTKHHVHHAQGTPGLQFRFP